VSACKTYSTAYGGIYIVTALYTKAASTPNHAYAAVDFRGPNGQNISQAYSNSYWAVGAGYLKVGASILGNDTVYLEVNPSSSTSTPISIEYQAFLINNHSGGIYVNNHTWSQIDNC
jgi:hypothetical protein